jgi:hypothetical protein
LVSKQVDLKILKGKTIFPEAKQKKLTAMNLSLNESSEMNSFECKIDVSM